MKSLKQQHEEVVATLNANTSMFLPYLGKNSKIVFRDGTFVCGQVKRVGGYFLEIQGLNGKFDESLRGRTKIYYNENFVIELI